MTLSAHKSNPSPRRADYDNRFIFHLEMRHGRPECALECNDYSVRRVATVLEYMITVYGFKRQSACAQGRT